MTTVPQDLYVELLNAGKTEDSTAWPLGLRPFGFDHLSSTWCPTNFEFQLLCLPAS